MAQVRGFQRADNEISPDEPEIVDRLGGLAWAGLFVIAAVTFALVANF